MPESIATLPENSHKGDLDAYLASPEPIRPHGLQWLMIDMALARHILRVALPVVLGMMTQTAVNILDNVMVARLPKAVANPGQAAIGASLPVLWLVGGFLSAIWVGTQAITARRDGEKKRFEAGQVLTNSLLIALVGGVLFSIAAIQLVPYFLSKQYSDPVVIQMATDYLTIRLYGVLAMVATFSFKSFFDGIGKTRAFMGAAILMNILNIVLNAIFIYGWDAIGVPSYGVAGAAWASVIAAYAGLLVLLAYSFNPKLMAVYGYYRFKNIRLGILKEIVRLSLPNGAATIIVMFGFNAFLWVVSMVNDRYAQPGNPVVFTAAQVVISVMMISFMSAFGFGSATGTLVGQALAAGRPDLARRTGWEAAKIWSYVMWTIGLAMALVPDKFAVLVNPDPEVITWAHNTLRGIGVLQGLVAIAFVLSQTLYAVGEARFVALVELGLHVLVMAPVAYVFGVVFDGQLVGLYLGPTCYVICLGIAMAIRFRSDRWQKIAF